MINTVRQLMHNIWLFCGTECSAASSWRQAKLKFFSYHRWSRYRSCGKRVTDSSQAVIISFVPTSFKSQHYLRPMRARDTAYFESYALHCINRRFHYSLSFALFCRRVLARRKWSGTHQCCYKFWLWIFFFVIYSSNIFFQNFFFQNFYSNFFFSKLF